MSTVNDDELVLFGQDDFIFPAWADQLTHDQALHMTVIECPFCSTRILVNECTPVYEYYDIALIHGVDDLMLAIILRRMLTLVRWNKSLRQASLKTVMTVKNSDGYYVQCHECGKTPVNSVQDNYSFPTHQRQTMTDWYEGAEPTETEIQDFTRVWSRI